MSKYERDDGPAEVEGATGGPHPVGTALIDGFTFLAKPVQYSLVKGLAIFEGDIILGPVDMVERSIEAVRAELRGEPGPEAVVITPGSMFGWPRCTIPYEINPDLPNQARVIDAVAHWEENTDFSFVLRTANNADEFPDYVEFIRDDDVCASPVGRRGGRQAVMLTDACTTSNCIHEIGHAAGLWHEQSRYDRDAFVTINWENIEPGKESNFSQHVSDGDDVGTYDYDSIMHYPRKAFSKNGLDTIVPIDPSAVIGESNGLSEGDIHAINSVLCPRVPSVRELTGPLAYSMIRDVGLVAKTVGFEGPGAWVWQQRPAAGTLVERDSIVTLQMRPPPIP